MLLCEKNTVMEQRIIIGRKELMQLREGIEARCEREKSETDKHEPFVPVLCQIINEIIKQQEECK
jgi:hypothetical protein